MSSIPATSRTRTVRAATRTDAVRTGARPPFAHGPQSPDEIVIGVALTTRWMLNTGRRLDQVPLMHDLTGDQLIDFWADDYRTETQDSLVKKVPMYHDARPSEERPVPSPLAGSQPRHVPMFAVDIAAFGGRDPDIQLYLRSALYRIVQDSCAAAGISWVACHHEDRGDGILVVTPGAGETVVLDPLIAHLRTRIRTHNKAARPAAQIRLRMAVNAGYVTRDAHGVSGKAVIQLFRMLNASTLKALFADRGGDFVLIVSSTLYQEVICNSPGPMDPDAFLAIDVDVKETHDRGWIWLPPYAAHMTAGAVPARDHARLRTRTSRNGGGPRDRPGSPNGLNR
jgi:hypothetical protein